MTHFVISFHDGVGRAYTVLLRRVAPNAYGGGGSPLFVILTALRPFTPELYYPACHINNLAHVGF